MAKMTITAHTGAFNTEDNSIESVKVSLEHDVEIMEIDVRTRPDGTVIISHDDVTSNDEGVEISKVFELVKPARALINLDIKQTKALKDLYDLILAYDMLDRVFLTGISYEDVSAVKAVSRDLKHYINNKPSRIKLLFKGYQKKYLKLLEESGALGINCNYHYASKVLANLLHDNGYMLSLWTIDSTTALQKALACSPDNITTHNPDMVEAEL